jgi:hypothetical protein
MNARMGLLRKKPDWTTEKFRAYWRNQHGPLAARAPNLREYWQNSVTDRIQRCTSMTRIRQTTPFPEATLPPH